MAARTHVDSSVNERRLRPIYDCLDNGNNKKAIQEAEKVLKKQKDFQCAKVLKALALLRTGKQEDSFKLLQEVHAEIPTDDATLQAMTICYREHHRLDMIAEIYEAATRKDPQNEELLTHLFMAYVRLGEYKKQQQVALNLYKLKAKNPYYFWGVMSIVMQAHSATKDIAQKMLLPLAERMTEKFVKSEKIEAEAEVQLYLLILELEHKYEDALNILEGPLGEKLTSFLNFKATKRAELLRKLERWQAVNAEYKVLVSNNPDNWNFYSEYLTSTMKLIEAGYQPKENESEGNVDYTMHMAQNFVLKLVEAEKCKENRTLRGPFLAYIKLLCLSLKVPNSFGSQALLVELLTDYFQRFGDKVCFFSDTMTHLSFVEDAEKPELLAAVKSIVNIELSENGINFAVDGKQMQRHLGYVQLSRYFGMHDKLSISERLNLVDELLQRYQHGTQFGAGLLSTDTKPNDGYSILVAHILIDVWRETGDDKILNQVIVILEGALRNSPSNYQVKLLLIKLYNNIGAVGPTYTLYESMGIKHIQQDVLGYLVTPHMAAKGHFAEACIIFGNMLKFFTANYKDTVDYLIASYKYGSFTKIQEFLDFRERLNNSLQYAMVAVERMIQDLILETNNHSATEQIIIYMEIDPEKDKTVWEDLRANWDLDIMVTWDPPSKQVTNTTKQLSFVAEVDWLRLRNLLVRCIAAAHATSSSTKGTDGTHNCNISNGEKRLPRDILVDLTKQLRDMLEGLNPDNYQLPRDPIQGPLTSRLPSQLRGGYVNPIVELLNLVSQLHQMQERGDAANEEKCDYIIKNTITKELKECISRVAENLNTENLRNFFKAAGVLEELVNGAEMLSFVAILLGFCNEILKPTIGPKTKKGKRKKEGNPLQLPTIVNAYNQLVTEVESLVSLLHKGICDVQIKSLGAHFAEISLQHVLPDDERDGLVQEVAKKIEKSYQQSLTQVGDLLQTKLKYLKPLRLTG